MFRDSFKLRARTPEQIGKMTFSLGVKGIFSFGKLLVFGRVVNWLKYKFHYIRQGGPLPVIKGGVGPLSTPYKWVNEDLTLLIEVITPLITGRGPPCG